MATACVELDNNTSDRRSLVVSEASMFVSLLLAVRLMYLE